MDDPWGEAMWKDIRYAFRTYRNNPVFVAVVLSSIALSIGSNTLIISILYALFLQPLPFLGDLDRLTLIRLQHEGSQLSFQLSSADFIHLRDRQRVFSKVAAYQPVQFNLSGIGEPERARAVRVSPDLFPLLGVRPVFGRDFFPAEFSPSGDPVLIATHSLWSTRLGADPGAIGRTVRLDGQSYRLVGVMPPGFTFPEQETDLWTPLALSSLKPTDLRVIARLRDDVSFAQVRTDMETISAGLTNRRSIGNRQIRYLVCPLREELVGTSRPSLAILSCAVAFLLLLACLNVASLQYARNETRRMEIATRVALGTGRLRLLRQFLVESILLASIGGLLGIVLAQVGLELLQRSIHVDNLPSYLTLSINPKVLLFAAAASVLTGISFGIAPITGLSKAGFSKALKEGGAALTGSQRQNRIYSTCAVIEVTLAFALLAGAATSVKSLLLLYSLDPGFRVDDRIAARISLPESRYRTPGDRLRFTEEVLPRLNALPGVRDAALISGMPMASPARITGFEFFGGSQSRQLSAFYYFCSPTFFQIVGIPVTGRSFTNLDTSKNSRVAMVSRELARALGGTVNEAIGKTLRREGRFYSIIGVAGDTRHFSLRGEPTRAVYFPFGDDVPQGMDLVVASGLAASALAPGMKKAVLGIDPDIPVFDIRPLKDSIDASILLPRVLATMLPVFSVCALMMAFVGLFGVVAYSISRRTRELAVRRAFGATERDVMMMVIRKGLSIGGVGVVIGAALSFALLRLMVGLLYGITSASPGLLLAISGGILVLSAMAALVPALRATRVEPAIALREE